MILIKNTLNFIVTGREITGIGRLADGNKICLSFLKDTTHNSVTLIIYDDSGRELFKSQSKEYMTFPINVLFSKVIGAHRSASETNTIFYFMQEYCSGDFTIVTPTHRLISGVGKGNKLKYD